MTTPNYKIYYSQNREDLMLAGILRKVSVGFYVDVGANHPELDSVTKIFYDRGWSGINVEPDERLNAELCKQRPRDINVKAGLSSQPGSLLFRSYDSNSGLSTFSSDLKQMYEDLRMPSGYKDTSLEVTSLSQVLGKHRPSGDIHFLKIDVEGLELEVLLGNQWEQFRPWVICLERNLSQARRGAIAAFLSACRYTPVFFDGINDYLVANERRVIWDEFSYAQEMILDGVPLYYPFAKNVSNASASNAKAVEMPMAKIVGSAKALLALDREEFVYAAYATLLSRAPDAEGFANCLAELDAGMRKMAIISRMRNSAEGRRRHLSLVGYRRALIWSYLGRS